MSAFWCLSSRITRLLWLQQGFVEGDYGAKKTDLFLCPAECFYVIQALYDGTEYIIPCELCEICHLQDETLSCPKTDF